MQTPDSPVSFYEWLKRRRKALDMTQDELAQRAGCSVGAVRKIESGERRPSKPLAELLAIALNIPDQERGTFVRIARGELNFERLGQPSPDPRPRPADLSIIRQAQLEVASGAIPKPTPASNRFPLPATPLIGRDMELAALERLLNDPQCRLITLTGTGGIGKTRLAVEFAARNDAAYPGGVFYIPLAPVISPQKIIPTVADVLDFGFSGPTDPKEQLFKYISINIWEGALFIFDNLEHLLAQQSGQDNQPGVVELIGEFLQRLPHAKIIATSRERLNIHSEWTYELHGLSVPLADFVGRLEDYHAITFFLKSAQRIRPDFQIMDEDQSSLIQICQMVEGVPLAIELAAAWVGMLSCQEIAQEIQTNMDFLATSWRDAPERHRSIRATFDHSWKLLTDEERLALCQLSVFHGGFERKAALQVAGATLPLLASLSDKSLVRRTESSRYDQHEVIRQYAMVHLDSLPGKLETYERHSQYFLNLVHFHDSSLKSALQPTAVRQLTDEIDNILAAWSWAIQHGKFDWLGQAGRGFGWYFEITGLHRSGIDQFEQLIQVLRTDTSQERSSRLLCMALIQQALLYFRKGEHSHALSLYEESIDLLRFTDEQVLLADALIVSGVIWHLLGEYEKARSNLEESLVFSRASHEPWYEAYAIYNLGYIASLMGSYAEGLEQMLAGMTIWRRIGDPHSIVLGLNFLVSTLNKLGRIEEAKSYMQESITLSEQSKNRWGMGTAYRYLGLTNIAEGQYQVAMANLRKSLEIFGEDFEGWDIALSRTYLGDALMLSGEWKEARRHYLDALCLSIEVKAIPIALNALAGLGQLQARTGRPDQALVLCYVVLNHPSSEADSKSRADQQRRMLETELSSERVRAARHLAEGEIVINQKILDFLAD